MALEAVSVVPPSPSLGSALGLVTAAQQEFAVMHVEASSSGRARLVVAEEVALESVV